MFVFRTIVTLIFFALAGSLRADEAVGPTVDFENDLQPIFTRYGCTSGPCHGKARGQGGFQLSLLGFDSDFDYDAIAKEGRSRRVFPAAPEQSLLLQKPTAEIPHGGGKRLESGSEEYRLILKWIKEGMPRKVESAPSLVKVTVSPENVVLKSEQTQPLTVTAHYDNGTTRNVTRLAAFQSNESPIASVSEDGIVTAGSITGNAAIMGRFMGLIAICDVAIPRPDAVPEEEYEKLPRNNFIDGLVWDKLEQLNITPSSLCDDQTYLRRVTTDICGRIPRPEEVASFLDDTSADKRSKLVDRLLQEPDFADHWANKWMDLLRPNPYRVGIKAVLNYDQWIRERFHQRMPWDQFVRELITARGSTFRNGAVTLFRDRRTPDEVATLTSQLFVGVRLECAKCHHHVFEKWSQDDFYSFAAYFKKVGRKGRGVSPPISGSEEYLYVGKRRAVKHPLTGAEMEATPLFGEAPEITEGADPRESLATWITSKDNPLFRQVIANRIWKDMMSRGLVEPVDDLRASNPPTNPELLEALAVDLRDNGYNLKHLIRRIANSYVYGLGSLPSDTNVVDGRNYSRFYRERLRAEVLLDSVSQITGIEEKFDAMPPGSTARQLWSHRIGSLFLDAFGRPDPNQDPPCERFPDTTIVQALHLMNSQKLYDKVTGDSSLAASLASGDKDDAGVIEELYLAVYARFPTAEEKVAATKFIAEQKDSRRKAVQDLLWAMLNTPEFVFKH